MKETPILFSAPMVRAIRSGIKTQTRRVLKTEPIYDGRFAGGWKLQGKAGREAALCSPMIADLCPYGQPGDQLWVRETHAIVPRTAYAHSEGVQQTLRPDDPYEHDAAIYREGWTRSNSGFRWRPSIHMPRWASRITLEITSVRVERLQDISEADCIAEGIEGTYLEEIQVWRDYQHEGKVFLSARHSYISLWESINGPGSWDANPWVWVVEFKEVKHGR
jgi:hypothetical protein